MANNEIQFKDTKAVLKRLYYSGTYDNHFEGSKTAVSIRIIEKEYENSKRNPGEYIFVNENGVVNLQNLYDNIDTLQIQLGDKRYVVEARTDWEHRLTLIWYGSELDLSRPLSESLERYTRNIEFFKHCEVFDIDNL